MEEIIAEKAPIEYEAPMPDYSIEGRGRPGEIVAIVAGTLLVLGISLGVGKVLETFYYLLGLFRKPQRAQRHAEKNSTSLRRSASSAVNLFSHDPFI